MPASRKAIEQRQETGARAAQRKKAPRRINSGSWDQHEHDDYDTNESEDSQSDGETDPDEMKDLNI